MFDGQPVIDGDSHKVENWPILLDYLPSQYRDRVRPELCSRGYSRIAFYDYNVATGRNDFRRLFARPDGPGKGLFAAFHPEGTLGGLFQRVRLEHMDREGIDIAILYPTVTMGLNALIDKEFSIALARAYNDYVIEDCQVSPLRLKPVALIPLGDIGEALKEMDRCWEKGVIGFTVAPSVPVPHPDAPEAFPTIALPRPISSPEFEPLFHKATQLGAALGIHGAGPGMAMPGGIYDFTGSFIINHTFAHRNQMQLALASCIFDGVFERFPTLKIGFLEGGCGWVPDLVHAFHEHWEKRVRDFDPDLQIDLAAYIGEMRNELGEERFQELSRRTRKSTLSNMVFHRRTDRTGRIRERDPYTWESAITIDPREIFKRGQMIFGFEPDDPAPAWIPAALGDWGANLPMFSVDYGHWDGEVAGCVVKVTGNEHIAPEARRLALGGNAIRFYGERLERSAAAMGASEGVARNDEGYERRDLYHGSNGAAGQLRGTGNAGARP